MDSIVNLASAKKTPVDKMAKHMERAKGFEPSTPTLARSIPTSNKPNIPSFQLVTQCLKSYLYTWNNIVYSASAKFISLTASAFGRVNA